MGDHSNRQGWTIEAVSELQRLWPDHTSAEIAELVGIKENSVIQKAWSLGLESKKTRPPPMNRIEATVIDEERLYAGPEPLPAFHPLSWDCLHA